MVTVLRRWFLMIQEPRVIRLTMFGVYLSLIGTGIASFTSTPDQFFQATGPIIVYAIGVFWIIGGVLGTIAILPGFWSLERIGLISTAIGIVFRGTLVGALGVSAQGALLLLVLLLLLVVRFLSIRRADLAPIMG